jgi:hypothetical protein
MRRSGITSRSIDDPLLELPSTRMMHTDVLALLVCELVVGDTQHVHFDA